MQILHAYIHSAVHNNRKFYTNTAFAFIHHQLWVALHFPKLAHGVCNCHAAWTEHTKTFAFLKARQKTWVNVTAIRIDTQMRPFSNIALFYFICIHLFSELLWEDWRGGNSKKSMRVFWFLSKTLKNMSISLLSTECPITEVTMFSNSCLDMESVSLTLASMISI